jgi:hypothetical protein
MYHGTYAAASRALGDLGSALGGKQLIWRRFSVAFEALRH